MFQFANYGTHRTTLSCYRNMHELFYGDVIPADPELRVRLKGEATEQAEILREREKITLSVYDLSSLENTMIVMEILDAAPKSAHTRKKVMLTK